MRRMCTPREHPLKDDEPEDVDNVNVENERLVLEEQQQPNMNADAIRNPEIPDDADIQEDVERMRNDAIGDTLFSQRFVMRSLMRLSNRDYELTDEFERNLCGLWDMSVDKDVVQFLLQYDALDIFTEAIDASDNRRLVEILVGTLGNMCVVPTAANNLIPYMQPVLQLVSCTDTPTLLQLMRLLRCIFVVSDISNKWLQLLAGVPDFVQGIHHILSNSTNKTLQEETLFALNIMLEQVGILEPLDIADAMDDVEENSTTTTRGTNHLINPNDIFCKSELVTGCLEAYEHLMPTNLLLNSELQDEPPKNLRKITQAFLSINCSLLKFDDAQQVYAPYVHRLNAVIDQQLAAMRDLVVLLAAPAATEELFAHICDISTSILILYNHCDEACFDKMLSICNILQKEMNKQQNQAAANEFEIDKEKDAYVAKICRFLKDFVVYTLKRCKSTQFISLAQSLVVQDESLLRDVCSDLRSGGGEAAEILLELTHLTHEMSKSSAINLVDDDMQDTTEIRSCAVLVGSETSMDATQ